MFKINRTTEYGLIALQHMANKALTELTSAREVSDTFGLPFEITAKTLQRLKDSGLIYSAQGARGGYTLKRPLQQVTLAEFLRLMEGPQSVVVCTSSGKTVPVEQAQETPSCDHPCAYSKQCEIKSLMSNLNERVLGFLSSITLAELNATPRGGA